VVSPQTHDWLIPNIAVLPALSMRAYGESSTVRRGCAGRASAAGGGCLRAISPAVGCRFRAKTCVYLTANLMTSAGGITGRLCC
jgi:hypothetical protein